MVIIMKINRAIQIFLVVFLVGNMMVSAAVDSNYECEDENCMEGTKISFNVTVLNNINKTIIVKDVYIKERDYGTILAYDTSDDIVLNLNEAYDFRFESTVKAPTQGYTFYYVPCFTVSHMENPDEETEICGKIVKSFTVIPLDKIECRTDDGCADDEYCNTFSLYKCVKLDCEEGQTIVNHKCVDILPQQITVVNWWNVFIVLLGIIVGIMLLLLLFGKKEESDDDFDIDLTNEETDEHKKDAEKINKEEKEQAAQEKKEKPEESKKTEKKNKAEKEFKENQKDNNPEKPEQDEKTEENPERKMKKKKARKKYKKVNKEIKPVIDNEYSLEDEKNEEIKKKNSGESVYEEETNQGVVDYEGYDDEDDEENRNPFI